MTLYCPECSTTFDDQALRLCPNDGARLYQMAAGGDDPLIGAVIDGRFRVDGVLGQGGMGTVYRGVQLSIHREVAIKVLRAELTDREVALERFFREAKFISGLSHPNIVRLIDFGQDRERDLLYLVMELVQGYSLGDLIREGRLRTSIALDVLYQACGALTEPHHAGVIHRDLKPDNILIVPMSDGTVQVKVLDFGIARALEQNTQITATGMICGTPSYMAPEQAQNDDLDPRTDLYSLGVIMYEMLTGWPPFTGTSSLQVMLKHIQENPTPIHELVPPSAVYPSVEALALEMMQKVRDARPASALDVRRRINDIRRQISADSPRIESGMTFDEIQQEWLLPKLPHGDVSASGPTEVLRRETGVEEFLTTIDSQGDASATDAEFSTLPLNRKNGERIKVPTRRGAQQGWTPSDQDAVKRKHGPADSVDVFGATAALETPSTVEPVRKTLVESGPHTDEIVPTPREDSAPAPGAPARRIDTGRLSTDLDRRPLSGEATQESSRKSALPSMNATQLTIFNVILGVVALSVAGAIFYLTRDSSTTSRATTEEVAEQPSPAPPPEVAEPKSDAPARRNNAATAIVVELLENKVAMAVREAEIATEDVAPATKKASPRKVKPREPAKASSARVRTPRKKGDAPASDTKPKEEISEEAIFGRSLRDH